jgi:hypothetical protein
MDESRAVPAPDEPGDAGLGWVDGPEPAEQSCQAGGREDRPATDLGAIPTRGPSSRPLPSIALVFLLLLAACLVATFAMVPFTVSLLKQARQPLGEGVPLWALLVVSGFIEMILSAAMIAVGLPAGARANLGVPSLRGWLAGDPEIVRRVRVSIGPALATGIMLGLIVVGLAWGLQREAPDAEQPFTVPPAWEGLLASAGAGIREEIWFRLGCMTILACAGMYLTRPWTGPRVGPPDAVVWAANLFAAFLFAAIHIPQTLLLAEPSARALAFVILGNGLPGLAFGWLYWRFGLISAMVAHFGMDLVLKVIVPLLQ